MHTFDGKSCRIHFNSDLSGECHMVSKVDETEIKVEGSDLIDFIANYVRDEKASKLEQMDSKKILGI